MMLSLGNILASEDPIGHVVDHELLKTGGGTWLLSNHSLLILMTGLMMAAIFPLIAGRYISAKTVPTGAQNFFEAILQYIRKDVVKPLLGDDTDRFIPYLWTLFFFILITNLIGLLPLDIVTGKWLGLGHHGHGIFGTATSNIYVTGVLAFVTFLVIQWNGIKANGLAGWLHHFTGGVPWWLTPIMVPVEIMGMIIKPCALAIRLAANMTAGHILLAVIIGFVPMAWEVFDHGTGADLFGRSSIGVISTVAAIAIMCLELFVALLQAYLFVFLTSLFISQLIVHHHEDGHHEAEPDEFGMSHADREAEALHKPSH